MKIFKIVGLFAICLFLVSCSSTRIVTLNTVNPEEVIRIAEKHTGEEGLTYKGYTKWASSFCTIWIVPKSEFDSEAQWERLLGHELRHCFEKSFHD